MQHPSGKRLKVTIRRGGVGVGVDQFRLKISGLRKAAYLISERLALDSSLELGGTAAGHRIGQRMGGSIASRMDQ